MAITKKSTKIKILDSAFQELITRGFVGFTINGVAERAGISPGNLTYHFPNREGLIQAMIDQWFETWKAAFTDTIKRKISGTTPDIAGFIEWVMDYALVKENVRTFTELWAMGNHEPKVAKMLDKLYEQATTTVIKALGVPPLGKQGAELRSLLYVLAALSEGSTAVLGNSPKTHPQRKLVKQQAVAILTPLLHGLIRPVRAR